MSINGRIQDELKAIREKAQGPYVEIGDFDRLLKLLEVAFCNHRFVTRAVGGDPAEACSRETVRVCELCGAEDDD